MSIAINGVPTTTSALDSTDLNKSHQDVTSPVTKQERIAPPHKVIKPTAEEQIHRLTLEGQSAKQIADILGLSEAQVLASLGSQALSQGAPPSFPGFSINI